MGCRRACYRYLAGKVKFARAKQAADRCKKGRVHGPDHFSLLDGGDVAYLDADVSGRMRAFHGVKDGVLYLMEWGTGPHRGVYANVDGRELAKGVHRGPDVFQGVLKGEFCVGSKGGGAETGDENCLGGDLGIGHYPIGALDDCAPEAAVQKNLPYIGGLVRDSGGEGCVLHLFSCFYQDGEQLSLFSPDDFLNLSAYGGGKENLGVLFVAHEGRTGQDGVSFLYKEFWNKPLEIRRFHSNHVRPYNLHYHGVRFSGKGNVETLFKYEIVGHYKNRF